MMNKILTFGTLALILALIGCMRGQSAGSNLDPNQLRAMPAANGTTELHLILPIKGKPYASATQWIFDQIVAAQAGGDVQRITVDPTSVKVTFSQQLWGEGMFIVIGRAQVVLTHGTEFNAYFREPITGGCQDDRIFISYGSEYLPDITAYRIGLENWKAEASGSNGSNAAQALEAQLSVALLVREITADGTVKVDSLEDWKLANQTAWSNRKVLGLE